MGSDSLDESSCLGWRDRPAGPPPSRHPSFCSPFLHGVDLVADDDAAELLDALVRNGGLVTEVVPPFCQRAERLRLVHVKHQDDRIRATEEGRREAREPLLARRILQPVGSGPSKYWA